MFLISYSHPQFCIHFKNNSNKIMPMKKAKKPNPPPEITSSQIPPPEITSSKNSYEGSTSPQVQISPHQNKQSSLQLPMINSSKISPDNRYFFGLFFFFAILKLIFSFNIWQRTVEHDITFSCTSSARVR